LYVSNKDCIVINNVSLLYKKCLYHGQETLKSCSD